MIEPATKLVVLRDANFATRKREVELATRSASSRRTTSNRPSFGGGSGSGGRRSVDEPFAMPSSIDDVFSTDGDGAGGDMDGFSFDSPSANIDFSPTRMGIEAVARSVPPKPVLSVEDTDAASLEAIANDESVRFAAPQMLLAIPKEVSDAELNPMELNAEATNLAAGQSSTWGVEAIGAPSMNTNGKGVTVAVLDTGIDRRHPAFPSSEIDLITENFTTDVAEDTHGHGTHCAGTVFGRSVDGIRIGVAPGVTRALIGKVIGKGQTTDALIDALEWAHTQKADIVSMSLGFDFPAYQATQVDLGVPLLAATSMALEAYTLNLNLFDEWMDMNRAREERGKGMLICAASGNESARNSSTPYRINTTSPAAARNVLSVGAVSKTSGGLKVSSFSNMRPQVVAPGVSIVSAKRNGGLIALNGTSMACPHVAGLAALLWEEMALGPIPPTPGLVRSRLLATARTDQFTNDSDFSDLGAGLAHAP